MHILLTNDDGMHADGLQALRKQLEGKYQLSIVAPHSEKSAIGHGITVHDPIRVDKIKFSNSTTQAWSVYGTPADCVKLALEALLDTKPDIIISGINRGANLGTDVLYSGTVSAAIEGSINNIPSIAVSLSSYENPVYLDAAKIIEEMLPTLEQNLKTNFLLNINIPDLPIIEVKGIEYTKLSFRRYINCIDKRHDPRGKEYYWLAGEVEPKTFTPGTDEYAVKEGFVSVTPMQFDLTAYDALPLLSNVNFILSNVKR